MRTQRGGPAKRPQGGPPKRPQGGPAKRPQTNQTTTGRTTPRARALQKNGDIELAKKEYGVLLEIDKENREAQEGLAEALLLEKKHN